MGEEEQETLLIKCLSKKKKTVLTTLLPKLPLTP